MSSVLAEQVITALKHHQLSLRAVESCTGGMVFAALTDISGASAVLDRGYITYSNQAKMELVGVSEDTLSQYGAVSEQTAGEMATGGLKDCAVRGICVAVTGIAGPSGGSAEKPVGLVHIATALNLCDGSQGQLYHQRHIFAGDRQQIRGAAQHAALSQLMTAMASI